MMAHGGASTEMTLTPFRNVLRLPGVKRLLLGGIIARVPYAAMGLTLTLYIVFGLDRGYFEAGLVGALFVIGGAIGSTVHGRIADRYGVRVILAVTSVAMAAFWLSAGLMSYPVLALLALPAGLVNLPVFVVVRQPLAALVPPEQRRTVYALDSTLVELAFMVGPAAAAVLATLAEPWVMPIVIGTWAPLAGALLWWINPQTTAEHELAEASGPRPARRTWMRPRMVAMLVAGVGATVALGGTDIAVVSMLESTGEDRWLWAVMTLWALYSMVGGFLLGATDRKVNPLWLLAGLGATTIPLGLTGNWWLLALALIPAGMACAPTIAASVDEVSRMVPASVRGEAMGMHGSAITIGSAVGAPFVGWIVDNIGVEWGFVAAGLGAVAAAVIAGALARIGTPRVDTTPELEPLPSAA